MLTLLCKIERFARRSAKRSDMRIPILPVQQMAEPKVTRLAQRNQIAALEP
jgi:hypothetical protein